MNTVGEINKAKCTGCKMCADICPVNAISFYTDKEGFWFPQVDESKCIKCNKCLKCCPLYSAPDTLVLNDPIVCSAWLKNEEIRIKSTSGGAFYALAKHIISKGGAVCGAIYNEDWRSARHVIVHDISNLKEVIGTKYFQSDTSGVYNSIKDELENGKPFLFCGTPCQNFALKSFLGKEYKNLYCVDFICRSINSPKAFKAYIDELEQKYNSKVKKVQLKNKDTGWKSLASKITFENGDVYHSDYKNDCWVRGFIKGDLYTRESCFSCSFRGIPRKTADISLGDFWGLNNQSIENNHKGISVIIINTEKGKSLLNLVRDDLVTEYHSMDEVVPGNRALIADPPQSRQRKKFFELLETHPFSYSVNKLCKTRGKDLFINSLRRFAHYIKLGIKYYRQISASKFFYYNFFCSNIVRDKNVFLIPYRNSRIDLSKESRIYISGQNLCVGTDKFKGSKAETYVKLDGKAVWNCKNGCSLFFGTVLEIRDNAVFDSGYFTANSGSVIIMQKHITFGENVMIGRNVIIYDSDFHQLIDDDNKQINPPQDVVIGDHVWLTANIEVLKGVTIGKDSMITAFTTVNKNVPEHSIVGGHSVARVINDRVNWTRTDTYVLK